MQRFRPWRPTAVLLLLLPACGPEPEPYDEVADVQQLMLSVLEPAAETYWDAVGTILDQHGAMEIRPESDAEWEAVVAAAYVMAESGNLLMMPGRAQDDGAWMSMSQALVDIGRDAIAAAQARDADAVFTVGGDVYLVCTHCHATYALETLRPNDERANGGS